ncbi:MAG TPA: endo-1,4-beta-xylanase, partial [Bacteroidales bacterium]
ATDSVIHLTFQSSLDNAAVMGIVLADSVGNAILRINCGGEAMTTKSGNSYVSDLAYIDLNAKSPSTTSDDWYKAVMLKYFNYGVCGNQFKWSGIEPNRGQLNYAPFENTLGWFKKVGWDMRAHTLLWGGTSSTDYHELPKWVGELPGKAMYDTCKMRVKREVTRYKGIVREYDVMNEPTHATYLQSKAGDSINWNCFKWAYEADPTARFFVNDYNIIEYQDQTDNFIKLVKKMLEKGAPVTGIGAQCHIGATTDIDNFKKRFDQLSQFGLPIKVTEFDMNALKVSQQQHAIEAAKMMRLCFSHPAIEGFIFWGIMDPGWADGVANLLNEDRTPKIVADTVYHLIHNVWTTKITDKTNASGMFTFKGYYGDYDILVKVGDTWKKYSIPYKKAFKDSVFVLNEIMGVATSPEVEKVKVNAPSTIEITFNKKMKDPSADAYSFKVFDNSTNYVKSAALKNGDSTTIVLTMNTAFKERQFMPVSYYPGNVESADGGKLEAFGPVLDNNLVSAYLSSSTSKNGKKVLVAFNGKLADTSLNAANFAVKVNNVNNAITAIALCPTKDTVYLTIANQVVNKSDVVTVTYTPGSLITSDSMYVAAFSAKSVTNAILEAKCVAAVTDYNGTQVLLSFNQYMTLPAGVENNFKIKVNGVEVAIEKAELKSNDSRILIFTLSSTFYKGDELAVSYEPGTLMSVDEVVVAKFSITATNRSKIVSVESLESANAKYYPNPVEDRLYLANTSEYTMAKVTDLSGKVLLRSKINMGGITELNTSNLKSGIYFIVLSNNKKQLVSKVVKK